MRQILVTGGAGFIGSNFVKYMLHHYKDCYIIVLDALTYAGNLDNFDEWVWNNPSFFFWHGNICDKEIVSNLLRNVDIVVHFAAETHVDRSIDNSDPFITTDIKGTQVLLEVARLYTPKRFVHISTSEVYGSAQSVPMTEEHPLCPQSPYAAAKAAADRLAWAFYQTYNLPIIILRPFNNYGPNQHPEKLIPLFITNALEEKSLPIYGDGRNTRDWVYVEDCCKAVDAALSAKLEDVAGEVINIGTSKEVDVLTITYTILEELKKPYELVKFVEDRPGHVKRLLSDTEKAKKLLGWEAETPFEEGLKKTVQWYKKNYTWWKKIKESEESFKEFYQRWYKEV